MSEPLQTYLHDHYSGSTFAVELLEKMQKEYANDALGHLSSQLLIEVNRDREVLKELINKIGSTGPDIKDAGAWLAEKATRLKLQHDHPEGLGAFEALETLSLGILGKRALWRSLKTITDIDDRVSGPDYDTLIRRAEDQFSRVEAFRLVTARETFAKSEVAV